MRNMDLFNKTLSYFRDATDIYIAVVRLNKGIKPFNSKAIHTLLSNFTLIRFEVSDISEKIRILD